MAYSPYKKGDAIDMESKRGLGILVTCNHGKLPTDDDAAAMKRTLDFFQYQVLQLRNEDATLDRVTGMLSDVRVYLKNYNGKETVNEDCRPKAIIFAFAGGGRNVCNMCNKFYECKCEDKSTTTKEEAILLYDGILRTTVIVNKLLDVYDVMDIPKLFFFDASRGSESLTCMNPPSDGAGEVSVTPPGSAGKKDGGNYRIDYATLPGHKAPANDQWMIKVAEYLRKTDWSLGDVMDEVRKFIYERVRQYIQDPQMPETLNRLTTEHLFLNKPKSPSPEPRAHKRSCQNQM